MPTGDSISWYCEHMVGGPWSMAPLVIPLIGAYFYGQKKKKLGWILIGIWLPLQIGLNYVNNVAMECPQLDAPISTDNAPAR
jgi:hypothetical protein